LRSTLFLVFLTLVFACSGVEKKRDAGSGGGGENTTVATGGNPSGGVDGGTQVMPTGGAQVTPADGAAGGGGSTTMVGTGGNPSGGSTTATGGVVAYGGGPPRTGTGGSGGAGGVPAYGGGPSRGGSGGNGGAGGATTLPETQFTFDTGVVSFGILPLGTTGTGVVTLTNLSPYFSATALITTTGGVTTTGCSEPVAPRASCQLTVSATPTVIGPYEGRVTIQASPGHYSPLNVFAVAAVTSQRFTLSPPNLPFGLRAVGEPAPQQMVTVTAVDDLTGLVITPVGAEVSLDGAGTTCTSTLARGASCLATVNYTAVATGVSRAHVDFRASGGADDDVVSVPVIAKTPSGTKLTVDPPAISSFASQGGEAVPSVDVALTYPVRKDQTVSVQMTGTNALDFVVTNNGCPGTVPPGMCTLSVGFFPLRDVTGSTRTATMTVTVAAEGTSSETASVPLTGTLYPQGNLTLSPSFAENPSTSYLPPLAIGMTGTFSELHVTSSGAASTGPLTISLSSSEFALLPIIRDGCSGESLTTEKNYCYFAVALKPTTAGLKNALLQVQGSDGIPVVRTLTGVGLAPDDPIVNPTNVDFGAVPLGEVSASKTIILQNFGATTKGPFVFDNHNAKDVMFITENTCTAALAPGASCALTVYFVPMYQATLHREVQIIDASTSTMLYLTGTVADS
jgi:hypothetical protein